VNGSAATRELVHAAGRAARVHALVRAFECAAAGTLGGAVVFAAGLASGAAVAVDLFAVAFVVAGLTAAIAWRERPARASDIARRADRAADLDGALGAVLDHARSSAGAPSGSTVGAPVGSTVAELLARRVSAVVRPGDLLRAALPRSPLALAAPLLAAAVVALALERRPTPVPGPTSNAAAGLRAAAEASRSAGARAAGDALEIAARRVEELERAEARRAADPDAARSGRAEREQTAADLARLARDLPAADSARPILLEAARALAAGGSGRALEPATGPDRGPGSRGSGPGGEPGGEAAARSSFEVGLANAPGDGRMFGPPAGGESDPQSGGPTSGTVATGGAGRGVRSARWWPSRYDAVVERYLTP